MCGYGAVYTAALVDMVNNILVSFSPVAEGVDDCQLFPSSHVPLYPGHQLELLSHIH